MQLNEAIAKRIRELLSEKNLSQYKLEQLSGITHNTLLCIMSARYKSCNLKTLLKIIKALEISTCYFFNSPLFDFNNIIIE